MDGQDPDRELWERARQRDEAAFYQLQRRCRGLVRGQISRVLCTAIEADMQDIEQMVWLAVWNALPQFRGVSTFRTWVCGVAKNTIFSWLRRQSAEQQKQLLATQTLVEDKEGDEGEIVRSLSLRMALTGLRESERKVICMRYFGQLTDEEIARNLQMPLGTVKLRLRSGLKSLRVLLEESEERPE